MARVLTFMCHEQNTRVVFRIIAVHFRDGDVVDAPVFGFRARRRSIVGYASAKCDGFVGHYFFAFFTR